MFIVSATSLQVFFFFYLFDGSQVPMQWRHDVIGKDAEQEGLYFLFTSVKREEEEEKSGSNETLVQKGPRVPCVWARLRKHLCIRTWNW